MFASVPHAALPLQDPSSINFEQLLKRLDVDFSAAPRALIERFRFTLDGLTYDVRRIAHQQGHHFLVNTVLGYLPFTIESVERREAIKTIVMASKSLPNVRLSVTAASRITASALFNTAPVVDPDFIFYPLVLFLQEARPFMNLLGHYLHPVEAAATAQANGS